MIKIEFKIDKEELSKKALRKIKTADKNEILNYLFFMPMRISIDDFDLFHNEDLKKGYSSGRNGIIGFATEFLSDVKNLPKKKIDLYNSNFSSIFIEMKKGNKIRIMHMHNLREATVNYKDFLKALEEFAEKVKKFLNKHVPPLREDPYWGAWIKGEAKWDNKKGLVPIKTKKKS